VDRAVDSASRQLDRRHRQTLRPHGDRAAPRRTRVLWVPMPDIASLVASIDRRLDTLNAEISHLEQARRALEAARRNGESAAAPLAPPSPHLNGAAAAAEPTARPSRGRRPRATGSRPARRQSSPLRFEDLERVLSTAVEGLSASASADEVGADYQATLRLLRDLEAAGQIRREGTRRSTRWRLITDDDRIAARAAELERLVRRAS
jgi:hypothetical protein